MRDVRIDQIGFAAELQKHFTDPLRERVKHAMREAEEELAEGEFFGALLVSGTSRTIDADKFLKLYEKGKITRAQFIAAVSVTRKYAEDCLSGSDLARISLETPATPQLRVSRLKAAEPCLVDAVKTIAAAIEHRDRNKDQP